MNWADVACNGHNPDLWFPRQGESDSEECRAARAVCITCPIKQPCLEYALDRNEEYGVWGGITARERQRILRNRRRT